MSQRAPFRTMLFVPASHPRRVEKALALEADAVILDLEDAVAHSEKSASRAAVAEALQAPRKGQGYTRINGYDTALCYGDLMAVVAPGLDGVVLPKVESAAQLASVDWLIAQLERERGLPDGAIDVIPIIETGSGVAAARAIAAAGTRVRRLSFGAGDYSRDMGIRWTLDEAEMAPARAEIVLASRLAGLEPPVDSVWAHVRDVDGLRRSAERVRDMGFQGKFCIHPNQIAPVNDVFTPTREDVVHAERVVSAFREAEAAGSASIEVDGSLVDYSIVETAQRTLDLIARLRTGDEHPPSNPSRK